MKIVQLSLPEIRKYHSELMSLMRLCLNQSYPNSVPDSFCEEKIAGLEAYLRAEKAFVFTAQEQEKLLGFLWAYPMDTPVGRRYLIYTPKAILTKLLGKTGLLPLVRRIYRIVKR